MYNITLVFDVYKQYTTDARAFLTCKSCCPPKSESIVSDPRDDSILVSKISKLLQNHTTSEM